MWFKNRANTQPLRTRPLIGFLDYPDVFEDFYPHYGLDQRMFATRWSDTGNHAFLSLLQREVGDVVWYVFSLEPKITETMHEKVGCRVKLLHSSLLHRWLWRAFYLPRMAWRWRRAYPLYAVIASYSALLSLRFLCMLIRERPDFFFVQEYSSGRFDVLLFISRILRTPLIAYHAGSRPEAYVGRFLKRWTIPRANKLIVSSEDELRMLSSRYRVSPNRLKVILTPIDTDIFRPLDRSEACNALGLVPSQRYLLFVGRLDDKVKRISAVIRAFASLKEAHPELNLLILGDGPDRESLLVLARQLAPERVVFAGWISRSTDLAYFYNISECLVLPSRTEGFPTVVGEAMACGTPVLASHVGGVSELVIDGETGWTFASADDDRLAALLAFVAENPDVIASMRPRAREIAIRRVSPPMVALALRKCFLSVGKICN